MFYKPTKFKIEELVSKDILAKYGEARLWYVFDPNLLYTIDRLSIRYGGLRCNNWADGGQFSLRGLRPEDTATGAALSMHKFGKATDLDSLKGIKPEELRQDILKNPNCDDFKFITCIESDVNWLHIDTRNYDKEKNGILIVKP